MHFLLLFAMGLGLNTVSGTLCGSNVADIHFLLDSSGSVGSANFQKQKDFVSQFAKLFTIGPRNILIGVTTFSSTTQPQFSLKDHLTQSSLVTAINAIPYQNPSSTHTGEALHWVDQNVFTTPAGHRSGIVKILIVMTDGQSPNKALVATEADKLHKDGVEVYVIGIGRGVLIAELEHIATDHAHVLIARNFDTLHTLQTQLQRSTCTEHVITTTTKRPCVDKIPDCNDLDSTVCSNYSDWADFYCPLHCRKCVGTDTSGGTDIGRIDPDPSLFG